jgi:membrane protein DedA with SNARE-associated domain
LLTEAISNLAVRCMETGGYAGAAFLMALESMIAPVPSEAVMPFVGFLVADDKWDMWIAVSATSLGSIVGSLVSYFLGHYGGKPLVLRVGRYLLISEHDLRLAEKFFYQRGAILTVFLARFIPVVRHLISVPAGIGGMPLPPFVITTLLGATIWNTFLLLCGMKLREHWHLVQRYSHQVDIVVVALLLVAAGLFVLSRLRGRRPDTGQEDRHGSSH